MLAIIFPAASQSGQKLGFSLVFLFLSITPPPRSALLVYCAVSAVPRSCVYFHAGREDSTDTCLICLAAFIEGEHLVRRTACNNKFHAICLFEWRVAENIQGQRTRCPLCRGHLYAYSTPATDPNSPKVEIVRLRLTLEVVPTSRRTTASGIAVRDLRSSLVRSGQFRQLSKAGIDMISNGRAEVTRTFRLSCWCWHRAS